MLRWNGLVFKSVVGVSLFAASFVWSQALPAAPEVEYQPFASQVQRIVDAFEFLGEPFSADDLAAIAKQMKSTEPTKAVDALQAILDKHVLLGVDINPESRVKTRIGPAAKKLVEHGWKNFLVKVVNEAGVTAELKVESPNAAPMHRSSNQGKAASAPKMDITLADMPQRFLDAAMFNSQPLNPTLSGLKVEYRILQLYCRDKGKREATLRFNVGAGTQDLGFRNDANILFDSAAATAVTLGIKDHDGKPAMASLTIRDKFGRVYPAMSRRLAPDFFFHPQIYRADGETVSLPAGDYIVESTRGPEYRVERRPMHIPNSPTHREDFQLKRWIELKKIGWWSGDHHIHAAGCAHYENPTQGVKPEDMFRHCLGEDLNVGCVLTWGPCWYFQKQFFEGKVHNLSVPNYLMRYDVEVSGFPSSHCGHLCLLNLKEDDYPNTTKIEQWPSWDLPVLKWGKDQGGVVGFSHSGWGLDAKSDELPTYVVPKFSGIGANEYVVDVVHGVCDFISTVDTPAPWELNVWYHTLNCGLRCRISGETDFPCIYSDRVGLGRVYVKHDGPLDWEKWVMGIKAGRSYVSDGWSHLIDFQVNGLDCGDKESQLDFAQPGKVAVTVKAAALLNDKPDDRIRKRPLRSPPYWHIERARVGDSGKVPVEVIVNGYPVAKTEIEADGKIQDLKFDVPIAHSSWVALRIYPSAHTNPVFIEVDKKPIRASKRSAEWCVKAVDQCWTSKSPRIRAEEKVAAKTAFDQAKAHYEKILGESTTP